MSHLQSVESVLAKSWDLRGELERLPGENENYLLKESGGSRFVVKVTGADFSAEFLRFEELAVRAASDGGLGIAMPSVVRNSQGEGFVELAGEHGVQRLRVLEFVEGVAWCASDSATASTYRQLGVMLAGLGQSLSTLSAPEAHRSHRWDLCAADQHRSKAAFVSDPEDRRLLEWAFHLHAALAKPKLAHVPRQLIHGDANHENLLLDGDRLVGLLDFGDCLFNPRICELAISLAYLMMDSADAWQDAATVVAGYHSSVPLEVDELAILFPLICGRLATTVAIAAERRRIDPDHPTWFETEDTAWRLLRSLVLTDPAVAGNRLAEQTGLEPFPARGASLDELLARREQRISKALSISYSEPLKIDEGRGQYLIDHRGRPFLDLVNNVCHVGHCHPHVVGAAQAQMARLNTNTRYVYDGLTDYADALCATLPESLEVCFFVNSGSEANELALRLARAHTGHQDFLVVDGAYHGHTAGLIAISPYKFMGKGGAGRAEPWVHVVPIADGYRGKHRGHDLACGQAYGDEVGELLANLDRPAAGFIAESLLGCGGQVIPPEGYFQRAYEHVRRAGGVCIADEVQVGFGRVGSHFWAFETQQVVPDIVVMGKPIGNGHPMAAVVTTREIADSFANGMEFFATFGGNPVACAIGQAVLDVIRDEGLQERAARLGKRMLEGLRALQSKHELIGEVRGLGLFVGIEFVRDHDSLEPAKEEATEFVNRMKSRGILLSTDGPFGNVIKIKPPMVLDEGDIDMFVRSCDAVLSEGLALPVSR